VCNLFFSISAAPGYFVPSAGASVASICGVGRYSTGGATTCSLCSPGYQCAAGSSSPSPPSAACRIGGYCNPATVYTPCPAGTYGIVSAGVSLSQACSLCEPGYLCLGNGTVFNTRVICPQGGYCPQGSSYEFGCAPGTFSTAIGQSSVATCQTCAVGTYCPYYGTVQGSICPSNHYCPAGTASYQSFPCPAGTYNQNTGLYSSSQCLNCTVGSYCLAGFDPTPCPQGSYNPFPMGSSSSSCITCEAGYACPVAGMNTMDTLCAAGHYCPPGTISATQYACPGGTYSDRRDLVASSGCTTCPEGYACGLGTTTASLVTCKAGHYCPLGTTYGNELPCVAGTYSNLTGLITPSDCYTCPPGFYCIGGKTAVSGVCSTGHYCPPATHAPVQYPCPSGTYTNSTSLHDIKQCVSCPPGHYCLQASTAPVSCPAGSYSPVNNTQGSSSLSLASIYCLNCAAGYRCPLGSAALIECGVGFYSAANAYNCTLCPKGHYCGSNVTTKAAMLTGGGSWSNAGDSAGICFNGTYCGDGMTRAPNLLQDACNAGYYCAAGATYQVPCPAGKYSESKGRDTLSDCITTPAGYYTAQAATSVAGLCNPGYYCPAGSSSPYEVPCPARTYRPEYGAESLEECSLCVAGGYCPRASVEPTVCPRGFYCPTGVSVAQPCPPGTYGNATGLRKLEDCQMCSPGFYCDGYGLSAPRGQCSPGYFCLSGSNSSTPYSLITNAVEIVNATAWMVTYGEYFVHSLGGICPSGYYCPIGSAMPSVRNV
jgi:hypothetical protein